MEKTITAELARLVEAQQRLQKTAAQMPDPEQVEIMVKEILRSDRPLHPEVKSLKAESLVLAAQPRG